jgi:hypothetical protein
MATPYPLFNALSVKVMLGMTTQRSHIVLAVIFYHTNRTNHVIFFVVIISWLYKFISTEFNSRQVLQNLRDYLF